MPCKCRLRAWWNDVTKQRQVSTAVGLIQLLVYAAAVVFCLTLIGIQTFELNKTPTPPPADAAQLTGIVINALFHDAFCFVIFLGQVYLSLSMAVTLLKLMLVGGACAEVGLLVWLVWNGCALVVLGSATVTLTVMTAVVQQPLLVYSSVTLATVTAGLFVAWLAVGAFWNSVRRMRLDQEFTKLPIALVGNADHAVADTNAAS